MAIDKLINSTQGDSMIGALGDIADNIEAIGAVSIEKLGLGYAICDTAAATAAKAANLANYALHDGGCVAIKFTYAVGASATLNINSTGAKAIYYNGSAIAAGVIQAGDVATFLYTSNQYQLIGLNTLITRKQDALVFEGTYNASTNKVATVDAIRQAKLTGYSTDSSEATITANTGIIDAVEQLDYRTQTNKYNISSFHKASGTDVYYQETEPTGDITANSYWISTSATKMYSAGDNKFNQNDVKLIAANAQGAMRCGTDMGVLPSGTYTIDAVKSASAVTLYYQDVIGDTYTVQEITTLPYSFTTTGDKDIVIRTASNTIKSWAEQGYTDIMVNVGSTAQTYEPYSLAWR